MTDGTHQPRPEITDEDIRNLRQAVEEYGSNYFKSRALDMDGYDASHVGYLCYNADFITRWNDESSSNIAIWRVVE